MREKMSQGTVFKVIDLSKTFKLQLKIEIMKNYLRILILILMFGFTFQLDAQTISIDGPTNVGCPPASACYQIVLEGSCRWRWGGWIGGTVMVTGPFSSSPFPTTQFGFFELDGGIDNTTIEFCQSFPNPGTYTICVNATQDCTWNGGDGTVSACLTIEVGGPPLPNTLTQSFCPGEIFSWCPGDWGVDEMISLTDVACDPFNAEPDADGCIEFEICTDGDFQSYTTIVSTEETDCGPQVTSFTVNFEAEYDCEDFTNDEKNVSNRSSESPILSSKSIKSQSSFVIKISPNPASDIININTSSSKYELALINANGQVLKEYKLSYNASVDVSSYIPGVYFLFFNNGFKTSTQKIILE